jgi:hypothetical protein
MTDVSVEHLLGLATGLPLVKLRVESLGTVIISQIEPAQAREIAGHLMEAAARAEYEADLANAAERSGMTDEMICGLLLLVRSGEAERHA